MRTILLFLFVVAVSPAYAAQICTATTRGPVCREVPTCAAGEVLNTFGPVRCVPTSCPAGVEAFQLPGGGVQCAIVIPPPNNTTNTVATNPVPMPKPGAPTPVPVQCVMTFAWQQGQPTDVQYGGVSPPVCGAEVAKALLEAFERMAERLVNAQ